MKSANAKCTMCGANLTLIDIQDIIVCDFCHTSNILQNSIDLAKSDPNDSMEIKALRENLSLFVQRDEIEDIVRVSSQIKNIIPNDFKANYYFAYGKQIYGQESPLYFFLKEPPLYEVSPGNNAYKAVKKVINIRVAKAAAFAAKMAIQKKVSSTGEVDNEVETGEDIESV
jgi:hypothetical protein